MTTAIRALIVDDELPARRLIRRMLASDHSVEIIGECEAGDEAIDMVKTKRPDLMFLDVQMPEMNGFEMLAQLRAEELPAVVFVTAFDQYALRAFETHALDYLLKPFDRARFSRTMERAHARVRERRSSQHADELLHLLASFKSRYLERITVRKGGKMLLLRCAEIDWIEAEGNYILIHAGAESYLLRQTLGAFEAKLDPARFIRVHRSAIVNLDALEQMEPEFHGSYRLHLKNGQQLTLSRGYRGKFVESFGGGH